jgi:hypothetical protein
MIVLIHEYWYLMWYQGKGLTDLVKAGSGEARSLLEAAETLPRIQEEQPLVASASPSSSYLFIFII